MGEPLRSGDHVVGEVPVRRHAVHLIIRQRNNFLLTCDVTSQRTCSTDREADAQHKQSTRGSLTLSLNMSQQAICLVHRRFINPTFPRTPWASWSVKCYHVFTFQLLFFGPVLLRPPHRLDELDEEGDPLVHVLLAERVSFHRVVILTDLHQRDNLTNQHKAFDATRSTSVSSPQTRCLTFLWLDAIVTTDWTMFV